MPPPSECRFSSACGAPLWLRTADPGSSPTRGPLLRVCPRFPVVSSLICLIKLNQESSYLHTVEKPATMTGEGAHGMTDLHISEGLIFFGVLQSQ